MQQTFKERLLAIGGHGSLSIFAEAAGIHVTNLSKQIGKGAVDPTLCAHLEWLEATPPAKWPDRWIKLRELATAFRKREDKAA